MYGKIIIASKLKVLTGLHIGGSSTFSAIGAVDSPVIRDPLTNKPIVPGSSLKGKMRTLLVRSFKVARSFPETNLPDFKDDPAEVKRLFGSVKPSIIRSRLQFADAFVCNEEELAEVGLTEVKWENYIQRNNAVANPRQIERVISGVRFAVSMTYEYAKESMKLLQMDYLGGHGTRGSGRVSFEEIELQPFFCDDVMTNMLPELKKLFEDVESYELLPV